MTRVKICGLRNLEQAEVAVEAGADLLGFVFAPSRRRMEPKTVAQIVAHLKRKMVDGAEFGLSGLVPYPLTVGVFENEKAETVRQIFSQCRLDVVQLHGDESPHYCSELHLPVFKAFRVAADLGTAEALMADIGDYEVSRVMLDAVLPGHGTKINWAIAAEVAKTYPTLLAGGLNPINVAEAISRIKPWGVDVSSGVETEGVKDPAKIVAFINAVKGKL